MPTPKPIESLALVDIVAADIARETLERVLDTHVPKQQRGAVQEVIEALYALTNDTDAIALKVGA